MSGHLFPHEPTENWINLDTVQDFLSPQKPLKCITNIQSIFKNRKFSMQKRKDQSNQIKEDVTAKINYSQNKTPHHMIVFKCINHPNKKAKYYEINTTTNGRNLFCSSCAVKLAKQNRKLYELQVEDNQDNKENKENDYSSLENNKENQQENQQVPQDNTKQNQNFQTPNLKKIHSNVHFIQKDNIYTPRKRRNSSQQPSSLEISSFQFEDNQVELLTTQLVQAEEKVNGMLTRVDIQQTQMAKVIEEQKSQVRAQFQSFIERIIAGREETLRRIDDQFASNLTILNKVDKKTKIYKHNIMNMKKELNQRQEDFFLEVEELDPMIEHYRAKIEQIHNYNRNVENMTLLIDRICQNAKRDYQITNDFQLVQKSKLFTNNSHRTPITDKKKQVSQSIVCGAKQKLVFKPLDKTLHKPVVNTIQKQRQSYLTPQSKF